jgi:hypothetical protein
MILALPERDVWRNDSRTVAGRHNQLGYVGACNCGGIAGAFHWCAIHLMAARQGIPIMPSRSSWAESYAGRTDDNCGEQLAGCFSHVEAMTSHARSEPLYELYSRLRSRCNQRGARRRSRFLPSRLLVKVGVERVGRPTGVVVNEEDALRRHC